MVQQDNKNPQYVGFFDGINEGLLYGWVRIDGGTCPIEIEIILDGMSFTRVVARDDRKDVRAAGHGDCGFSYPIPEEYCDGATHQIRFVSVQDGVEILGGIHFVDFPPAKRFQSLSPSGVHLFSLRKNAEKPAISVVIPTYNRADLIGGTLEAIDRVIADDPVEIVVVDDGSRDETPDLLTTFASKNSHTKIVTLTNSGPGRARNAGVTVASGNIVLFVGDDTRPTDRLFFRHHWDAHSRYPSEDVAVLGKVIWPNRPEFPVNFVMNLIQGDGQQQFGYKYMKPWTFQSTWAFYTSNVSVKRSIVSDWEKDGFSSAFPFAAFEDAEFAYRLKRGRLPDFRLFYVPTASVEHFHFYTTRGFCERQTVCGMMMDVFLTMHPETAAHLLDDRLAKILASPDNHSDELPIEHYSNIIEGLKSWLCVIESHYRLGSQNWHADLANAVFRLCHYAGYLQTQTDKMSALPTAYRHILENFRIDVSKSITTEFLGDLPNFGFI